MGWGSGTNAAGRDVGYLVPAVCDHEECDVEIDRGLAYCCGGMHNGGEHGCGSYFCSEHLVLTGNDQGESPGAFLCEVCATNWDLLNPDVSESEVS